MNARSSPFGRLLCPSYDHHGLKLDLYGTLDDDGYSVKTVCIPNSMVALTECVDGVLLDSMSSRLDDTLPSAAELRKESRDDARVERAVFEQDMRLFGWGGMS